MESIKLHAYVDQDGILRLEFPVSLKQRHVEVFVVMQPIDDQAVDAMGYPIGYFDETYGINAHDPIERGDQLPYDTRDEVE